MTSSTITGALVVCVAAAGIAAGARPRARRHLARRSRCPAAPPSPGPGRWWRLRRRRRRPAARGPVASLEISGFQFGAATVGAGGQVTVSNRDGAPHTATADDGGFDSGQIDGAAPARSWPRPARHLLVPLRDPPGHERPRSSTGSPDHEPQRQCRTIRTLAALEMALTTLTAAAMRRQDQRRSAETASRPGRRCGTGADPGRRDGGPPPGTSEVGRRGRLGRLGETVGPTA